MRWQAAASRCDLPAQTVAGRWGRAGTAAPSHGRAAAAHPGSTAVEICCARSAHDAYSKDCRWLLVTCRLHRAALAGARNCTVSHEPVDPAALRPGPACTRSPVRDLEGRCDALCRLGVHVRECTSVQPCSGGPAALQSPCLFCSRPAAGQRAAAWDVHASAMCRHRSALAGNRTMASFHEMPRLSRCYGAVTGMSGRAPVPVFACCHVGCVLHARLLPCHTLVSTRTLVKNASSVLLVAVALVSS
jgi:hypothetical protein